MRLERCAIDRPCTLKCLRVASPPCPTAVIVCVLTSSRPRDIHKVTHVSWPPAGPTPVFRLRGITHEDPNTFTTGESFRVAPPRRPGAKAQSLRPCYVHVPNRKASRVCPGSLQARPRGCVLVNRYMKIETQLENRFERRCSGSSSPVYHGLSSTAPHLHLHHQPRHQPRVILQVCLAWHLLLAAAARTRLAPPLLRPPPSMSLVFAQKCLFREGFATGLPACHARPLEACDASFRLDSFAMESIASGVWTWRRCLCMNGLFLSLQDVNARTMEARRDGGLACVS